MPEQDRFDSPADRQVGALLGRVAADAARMAEPVNANRIRRLAARRRDRRAIASGVVSVGAIAVAAASACDERVQPAGSPSPTAEVSTGATTTVSASPPVTSTVSLLGRVHHRLLRR
jgi:hypothetical protein